MIIGARRMPVGAEVMAGGRVHFRVWAPVRSRVAVVMSETAESIRDSGERIGLAAEGNGYFSGIVEGAREGMFYLYALDRDNKFYPDPASRFQPKGPTGPSQIINPDSFVWTDRDWKGVRLQGQVLYEMHIGTFTKEGTWESAARQLKALAETGITCLELMPIVEFPGDFNWGYDAVNLFAPAHVYGNPDDMRRFVDTAHRLGIGIVLDVVYNHVGPVGAYFKEFSPAYFTDRYWNEWGDAINFDGPDSGPVREFFLANTVYWIDEFHLDGLRIDATQAIFDRSTPNIMAEICRKGREAADERSVIFIAESEPQDTRLVTPPDEGGYGMDALWNDDFHHSAVVAPTGHNAAYYTDYLGKPQEFISAIKWGYLYQGQRYKWQRNRRGTPSLRLKPETFVLYIENHDQLANSGRGKRMHSATSPGRYRAMTALMLLSPGTPMLFQGQEFGSSSPFYYFGNVGQKVHEKVHRDRVTFLWQFRNIAQPEMDGVIPRPDDPETFLRSKLDHRERETHTEMYTFHRDLLKLRREDPTFSAQRPGGVDGAVLADHAFVLRFFGHKPADDRLLIVNFGRDEHLDPAPEPLLAPPLGMRWETLWSSEHPMYGGTSTPPLDSEDNWRLPGEATVAMKPRPVKKPVREKD